MDDVRKAALKRAAYTPVGTSFETERQRSKNALVKQITVTVKSSAWPVKKHRFSAALITFLRKTV